MSAELPRPDDAGKDRRDDRRRSGAPVIFSAVRAARIGATFAVAFGGLFLLLASGLSRETEVSWAIPFGLLPIAALLGLGAAGLELANAPPVARRDRIFGLSAALAAFAILRLAKIV
jgi:hypothetical protein